MTTTIRPQVLTEWADDFVGFAAKLDILPKEGPRTKLRPNEVQAAFEPQRTGRDIILKPRQIGFTTWELARDVWFFLTRPGAQVRVLCQTDKDGEALKSIASKLRIMLEGLVASGLRIEVQNDATDTWVFGDSSLRIVECGGTAAAAKNVGRGGSVQRLHVTELAFFQYPQETLTAILPCVPNPETGSEVTIESTACGASGVFFERYKAAKHGRGEFAPYFIRWTDHTEYTARVGPLENLAPQTERERELVADGATPGQLKWYRRKVEDAGQDKVDQEFPSNEETCWLIAGRLFFDKDRLNALLFSCETPARNERSGALRVWSDPRPGVDYLIVADTSSGMGEDPSAACVYERATGLHVATLVEYLIPWDLGAACDALGRLYNTATIVVERNNHGPAVLQSLEHGDPAAGRLPYPYARIYDGYDNKPGWNTTPTSRPAALDALQAAIQEKIWLTPDRAVVDEMLLFVVHKGGKAAATFGAHDELVMVSAIAWDVLRKPVVAASGGVAPAVMNNATLDTTPVYAPRPVAIPTFDDGGIIVSGNGFFG